MHHDVAARVARLLSGVTPSGATGGGSGLTVIQLDGPGAPLASAPPSWLEVAETAPPNPATLSVTNRGPRDIALHSGDLFAGGLADRASLRPHALGPNEHRVVPVEAVEGRWWSSGRLALTGMLDPPRSALIALMTLGERAGDGASASARTALWSLGHGRAGLRDLAWEEPTTVGAARGWLVLAGARVLAVRIWGVRRPFLTSGAPPHAQRRDDAATARQVLTQLATAQWTPAIASGTADAEVGGLHARLLHHAGAVVELSAVRLTDDLARILRRDPAA